MKPKKPSLAIAVGIGEPQQSRLSEPPKFGRKESAASEATPVEAPKTVDKQPVEPKGAVAIPPHAVCFRDASETCGNCRYMAQDGMCEVIQTAVQPGDGCNAFSGRDDAGAETGEIEEHEA